MDRQQQAEALTKSWESEPRWQGVERPYTADQVVRLRSSFQIEYTIAQLGSYRLWNLMNSEPYVQALGALTGNQAVQQVLAGLKAIYLSGWQVAADANTAGQTYPDQSLYPADSVPAVVRKVNNALLRADQLQHLHDRGNIYWLAPIVADIEAGFGGPLNTFELTKACIDAGAAGVHLEDQISSLKKCGHMGGKVLAPSSEFLRKFAAARLAADVMGVPTLMVARTDAKGARLTRSDIDLIDQPFLTGKRTMEGYFELKGGLELAIARALSYAPYADVIWCETSTPDLGEAREFAQAILEKFPNKFLAYNCSPSFNWKLHMDDGTLRKFQEELGTMGYKFQFVTLAGFHALNASMFELAHDYKAKGMAAYSQLQEHEFQMERELGYSAVKHQSFVGAGYYDEIQMVISGGETATAALKGSTEEEQFER
ncbi:MAG: isocitrate lyase [Deltaproteobacteria bacterium]|nr:isocitrate lyase [Deltaproteobacteria bacterium]